jgi:hypothetical protein
MWHAIKSEMLAPGAQDASGRNSHQPTVKRFHQPLTGVVAQQWESDLMLLTVTERRDGIPALPT